MSTVTASKIDVPGNKFFTKPKARLFELLQEGTQPRQLALALAIGATIGILPTVWGTSLLCIVLAWLLRLNQLVVQLANCLVYPLQILLFVPFFQLGELLFSSNNLPDDLDSLFTSLHTEPTLLLSHYWQANLQAALVWLLATPLQLICGYLLARLLINWLRSSKKKQ